MVAQLRPTPASGAGTRPQVAMVLALLQRSVSFALKRVALVDVLPDRMKRHVLVGQFHQS